MHEPLVEHLPEGPSNRSFGYTVGGILVAIALAKWMFAGSLSPVWIGLACVGAILVVLAFASPDLLATPNRLWAKLGLVLFKIVNPIVMLMVYVVTVVPIGLFLRLRGYDPLGVGFDRSATTYWKTRAPDEPEPSTMRNQF